MSDAAWAITAFCFGVVSLFWGIYIGKGVGYRKRMIEEIQERADRPLRREL